MRYNDPVYRICGPSGRSSFCHAVSTTRRRSRSSEDHKSNKLWGEIKVPSELREFVQSTSWGIGKKPRVLASRFTPSRLKTILLPPCRKILMSIGTTRRSVYSLPCKSRLKRGSQRQTTSPWSQELTYCTLARPICQCPSVEASHCHSTTRASSQPDRR
jgi:hypothetical protein